MGFFKLALHPHPMAHHGLYCALLYTTVHNTNTNLTNNRKEEQEQRQRRKPNQNSNERKRQKRENTKFDK